MGETNLADEEAAMTFAHYEEMWAGCFEHAFGQPISQPQAELLKERRSESEAFFEAITPVIETCLKLFVGEAPDLPAAPQASVLFFLSRFLKIRTLNDLAPDDRESIRSLLRDNFLLGLACHLILWASDTRSRVGEISHDRLFRTWTERAGMADMDLRDYNKHQQGVPRAILDAHFWRELQPSLKRTFRVGTWRMGKAQNRLRNQFYSGILLGMVADLEADKV